MTAISVTQIGKIGNAYGCLWIKKNESGKCYWGIEDCDMTTEWEEIPESLYNTLLEFKVVG